jgi:hypothetical protein
LAPSFRITYCVIQFCDNFNCFCFLRAFCKQFDSKNKLKFWLIWVIGKKSRKIIKKNVYSFRLRSIKWKLLKITYSDSRCNTSKTNYLSQYLGRFNFSKISKSILEFYFLRFCCKYDWNLWRSTVSNKYFFRNETKGLISNTNYLGCLNHKLYRRSIKLS